MQSEKARHTDSSEGLTGPRLCKQSFWMKHHTPGPALRSAESFQESQFSSAEPKPQDELSLKRSVYQDRREWAPTSLLMPARERNREVSIVGSTQPELPNLYELEAEVDADRVTAGRPRP